MGEAGEGLDGHPGALAVEDEKAVRDMVSRIFRDAGYTAIVAENGEDALDSAEQIVEHIVNGEELFAVRCMRNHLNLPKKAITNFRSSRD